MAAQFHFSIGARSLKKEISFFKNVLMANITHEESAYVNLEIAGVQLTLKPRAELDFKDEDFHFGLNLSLSEFEETASRALQSFESHVIKAPHVIDAGTDMERKKMYLKSPSGYLIELKGYKK